MKISASIYSNKTKKIETLTEELDSVNIDMFHIDFNDRKVNAEKIEDDLRRIRKVSKTPIDLHIISETPSVYYSLIERNKIERVAFQLENIQEKKIQNPNNRYTEFGIAVTTNTNIDEFNQYSSDCKYILMMTTTPGESGGNFNKTNFKKIRDFKKLYPEKSIHVDGGINDEIGFIMRILGVQSVVSGSFLVKNDIAKSLLKLKSSVFNSKLKVKEFMMKIDETPIIKEFSSFQEVLHKIDEFGFGYALVENQDKEFIGIISMADIRKGLINNDFDINKIKIKDIINYNPVSVESNKDINYMLKTIQNHEFLISFVPIIDNRKIRGSITFFNLINSES